MFPTSCSKRLRAPARCICAWSSSGMEYMSVGESPRIRSGAKPRSAAEEVTNCAFMVYPAIVPATAPHFDKHDYLRLFSLLFSEGRVHVRPRNLSLSRDLGRLLRILGHLR